MRCSKTDAHIDNPDCNSHAHEHTYAWVKMHETPHHCGSLSCVPLFGQSEINNLFVGVHKQNQLQESLRKGALHMKTPFMTQVALGDCHRKNQQSLFQPLRFSKAFLFSLDTNRTANKGNLMPLSKNMTTTDCSIALVLVVNCCPGKLCQHRNSITLCDTVRARRPKQRLKIDRGARVKRNPEI